MKYRHVLKILVAALLVMLSACTRYIVKKHALDDETLILEVQIMIGKIERYEIRVSEGESFRTVVWIEDSCRVIEGDIKQLNENTIRCNITVEFRGSDCLSSETIHTDYELTIDEMKGEMLGFFGSRYLFIGGVWIRRGEDAVPMMIRQIRANPDQSIAAIYYLGSLGCKAEKALPVLKELLGDENTEVKSAAKQAFDDIKAKLKQE